MSRTDSRRVFAGLAAIAVAAIALTGCSSEPAQTGKYPDLTLAETKSPTQLLRNEAASRVPEEVIEEIVNSTDKSTNCITAESDPDGLIRSWGSSVRIAITPEHGAEVQSIVDDLAQSFVEQGWEKDTFGVATIIDLASPKSPVSIHVSVSKADAETGEGGAISLTASGPCVETDGGESDEVKNLEKRAEQEG
jgi:hypothetical protein